LNASSEIQYADEHYVQWLEELRQINKLIDKISEVVQLLANKRVTLEEKIICHHFHMLASEYSKLCANAHNFLAQGKQLRPDGCLPELKMFNSEVDATLEELIKIVKYNLNFLEQYFEYDYANRLQEKHRFAERLAEISANIVISTD
jgi:hypothetical protein